MNSWDRLKVIEKVSNAADVHGSSNPQQQKQLIFSCKKAKEQEIFFGLFSFFYDSSLQTNQSERQELAGTILYSVLPSSPLTLDASVYAAAKYWDLSVEELPWYWCKIFGKSTVMNFITELIPDCKDDELKNSLETMLFWCRNYEKNNT
ncbi:MAG: hypothetical protein KZQ93_14720 [Candidatus Thiodiazotropha sp. (ex Monitilora ramsayi)]|nr:hypothetical protein [Candidatus Thiodiazotropha sp. (ex Monitilora ramsayi)]